MIRVILPHHLRMLAGSEAEILLNVEAPTTIETIINALEELYPMLKGTIRNHASKERRPLVRFFACEEDLSNEPSEMILPEAVTSGAEPFIILGAIAGG